MKRWACDRGGDEQGKMRSILEVKGFEFADVRCGRVYL